MALLDALTDANFRIATFLAREQPDLDSLFRALDNVAPYLPVANPTIDQRTALLIYRKNLETLHKALDRLEKHWSMERASLQSQRDRLTAAVGYQASRHL